MCFWWGCKWKALISINNDIFIFLFALLVLARFSVCWLVLKWPKISWACCSKNLTYLFWHTSLDFLAGTYSSVFDYCAGRCCHCSESVVSILLHSSYLVLEILTFRNVLIWLPLITYTTSHLQGCLWPYSIKKKIPFMATDFCQTWFRSFSH